MFFENIVNKAGGAKRAVTVLIIAALSVFGVLTPAAAVPIPITGAAPSSLPAKTVTFASSSPFTANGFTSAVPLAQYGTLDVQYIVVGASGQANATTYTMQYSNDKSSWVDGAAIGTSVAAVTATTDITRVHNFAAWTRIKVVVTNSNVVTLTFLATAR